MIRAVLFVLAIVLNAIALVVAALAGNVAGAFAHAAIIISLTALWLATR